MRTEPLLPHCQPFLTGPGGDQRQALLHQGTTSNRLSNKALKSPFANLIQLLPHLFRVHLKVQNTESQKASGEGSDIWA